jgi:hypothetical protein
MNWLSSERYPPICIFGDQSCLPLNCAYNNYYAVQGIVAHCGWPRTNLSVFAIQRILVRRRTRAEVIFVAVLFA